YVDVEQLEGFLREHDLLGVGGPFRTEPEGVTISRNPLFLAGAVLRPDIQFVVAGLVRKISYPFSIRGPFREHLTRAGSPGQVASVAFLAGNGEYLAARSE